MGAQGLLAPCRIMFGLFDLPTTEVCRGTPIHCLLREGWDESSYTPAQVGAVAGKGA